MNMAKTIQSLYARFGRLQGITIECQKELIAIGVTNTAASAEVFLQGAQISRFKKKNKDPILFLSKDCSYQQGDPLRGGIPICWPWFGQLEKNNEAITAQYQGSNIEAMPAHGIVRAMNWELDSIETPRLDLTVVEFSLHLNAALASEAGKTKYQSVWPFSTQLRYRIEIGEELTATFTVCNLDSREFSYSTALHSYFKVDHINNAIISGFSKTAYVDALDQWREKRQVDDIAFNKEVDRIYKSSPEVIVLSDRNRIIAIKSTGSKNTVIWNPWIDKSQQLSQFADTEYQSMVCIESANVLDDAICLQPGDAHSLALTIT